MTAVMAAAASGVLMGVGATLIMDLWNLFLGRAFGIRSLDYCLLGRWVRHMPWRFRHASIGSAPEKHHECLAGWAAHYSIGIALALAFTLAAPDAWLASPTPLPALLYGVATVALPFFVLQPSLGLGVASSRAPRPALARMKSVGTHTVFGLGLYAGAALLAM